MAHSSHFLLLLLWAITLFHAPVLAEYGETNDKCKDILQRREWCDLLIDFVLISIYWQFAAGESLITLKKPTTSKLWSVYKLAPLFTKT